MGGRWALALDERARLRLERKACRLGDPVARLRYLQHQMQRLGAKKAPLLRTRFVLPASLVLLLYWAAPTGSSAGRPLLSGSARLSPPAGAAIWVVQESQECELYSNGLRIELAWRAAGEPRRPRWLARRPSGHAWPTDPAGIVFHASESDTAPFRAELNERLKREGESLLSWVRRHKLYHYVVDRFGRVYRILGDQERAHHAGQSLWADADFIYFDLNESFLGVCLEACTTGPDPPALTAAQIQAARLLVQMLRARYGFSPANCVTHAQVSVNPLNGLIGYHSDWADGFPFESLGLPDNYAQPLPSLLLFGFEADTGFMQRAGPRLREVVEAARQEVSRQALNRGLTPAEYRRRLAEQYRQALRSVADMQQRRQSL